MPKAKTLSESKHTARAQSTLAKPLAPEDVRKGDFVTLLHETCELPSFLWSADSFRLPCDQLVRIQLIPETSGIPLRVCSVCLPFLFVKEPSGKYQTLDLRKYRLARLHEDYGKTAWKALKTNRPISVPR